MVNFCSNKQKREVLETTEEKLNKRRSAPVTEVDLETPEQIFDDVERKTTESTPMPNVEEQETKTIEFSPIGNGNEVTSKTLETTKDNSQTKKTEIIAAIVRIKTSHKEEVTTGTDKGKTFGAVSAIKAEVGEGGEQSMRSAEKTAVLSAKLVTELKVPPVVLGDLMLKLNKMDKKLRSSRSSEEEREEKKRGPS